MLENSYDEMKSLLKKSKMLFEQYSETGRINTVDSIANKIRSSVSDDAIVGGEQEDEANQQGVKTSKASSKQQKYKISGGIFVLHGDTRAEVDNITTDDKSSFQETMDEFVEEVSDLVDFDELHLYKNSVEWGGKLIDDNITFLYTIGENGGVYISADIVKIDEDFLSIITKLEQYYQKFKSKWSKMLAIRKKTPN
jgi:coenzyme F420-reducing hydrogenase delta subunit